MQQKALNPKQSENRDNNSTRPDPDKESRGLPFLFNREQTEALSKTMSVGFDEGPTVKPNGNVQAKAGPGQQPVARQMPDLSKLKPTVPPKSPAQLKKEEQFRETWGMQHMSPEKQMQLKLKYNKEGLEADMARGHFNNYVKQQAKQLKRNKHEKNLLNNKANAFKRAMIQNKIAYGSPEYNTAVKQCFPDFDTELPAYKKDVGKNPVNNDPKLEHEADVMGKQAAEGKTVQKQEEERERQAKKEGSNPPSPSGSGTKTKLPEEVQSKMENSFGTSFSDVNIHPNDEGAKDMGALAYTQGKDVHFAPGQYSPGTQKGQELIGHELTHVEQQKAGRVQPTAQGKGMAVNDDPKLENEADEMGKKAAEGKAASISGNGKGLQKKEQTDENGSKEAKSKYESYKSKEFSTSKNASLYTIETKDGKSSTGILRDKAKKFDFASGTLLKGLKVTIVQTDNSYEGKKPKNVPVAKVKVTDEGKAEWNGKEFWTTRKNISAEADESGLYTVISGTATIRNDSKIVDGPRRTISKTSKISIREYKMIKGVMYVLTFDKETKEDYGWIKASEIDGKLLNETMGIEKASYVSENKNHNTINRNNTIIYKEAKGYDYSQYLKKGKEYVKIPKGTKIKINNTDGNFSEVADENGTYLGWTSKGNYKSTETSDIFEVHDPDARLRVKQRKYITTGKKLNAGDFVITKGIAENPKYTKIAQTEKQNNTYTEKESSEGFVFTDNLTAKWADAKGKHATWSKGVYTGQIDLVYIVGHGGMKYMKADSKNIENDMSDKYVKMAAAAKSAGITLSMASGFRDYPKQKELRQKYLNKQSSIPAARPGYSKHQIGIAVDLNYVKTNGGNNSTNKWLMKNAYKFGFVKPLDMGVKEAHHWEYRPSETRSPKEVEKKEGKKTIKNTRYYFATWSKNLDKEWTTYKWRANCYDTK